MLLSLISQYFSVIEINLIIIVTKKEAYLYTSLTVIEFNNNHCNMYNNSKAI